MTKNLEWTDKHWTVVRVLLQDNGPTPWDSVLHRLRETSNGTITDPIGDLVLKRKIAQQEIEVVRRGSSRRKGGALYVRLRKPITTMKFGSAANR